MMLSTSSRALCRHAIPRSLLTATSVTRTAASETSTVTCSFRSFATARRRRPKVVATKYQHLEEQQQLPDRGGLQQAFVPAEQDFGDYLAKASLSPWVPVPDPVARKMLEIAKAGPEDIHVELGSGDGRMNFHALDAPFSVQRSIGVDIDEQLVGLAKERLAKRHPAPTNIEFRVQDLMATETSDGSIWKSEGDSGASSIREATVITMYFVQDALRRLKPKLEMAALPDGCRVVCCGYAMPEWEPDHVEVILDLPIYLYTTPFYKNRNDADDNVRLTPSERIQLEEEDRQYRLSSSTSSMLLEEMSFSTNSQDDDVEEIHVPLFDPATMIDGHWDDFDQEDEEDLDGNPAISKWRHPE